MAFMGGSGSWGSSNWVGRLYRAQADRLGNEQAGRGVDEGDIVLCLQHAGDHFYKYVLVQRTGSWLRGVPEATVGSYSFSGAGVGLTDRQYHLLAAGERVKMPEGLEAAVDRLVKGEP